MSTNRSTSPWSCEIAGAMGVAILLVFAGTGCGDEPALPELPAVFTLVEPDGSAEYPTIQAAIDAADEGDVIELADGVFRGNGNRDLDLEGKSVTVRSRSGHPQACIIDCEGKDGEPHRGFSFRSGEGSDCVVAGLTIRGGYVAGEEGHELGGAVFCRASSPHLSNCILERNTAWNGGGMACMYGGEPSLADCVFSENVALNIAGGILCYDSDATFHRCTFYADTAWNHGGGVECYSCAAEFEGCVFSANYAWQWGGALSCERASPSVTGCTFVANVSRADPCVISLNSSSDLRLAQSIMAFNGWIPINCNDGSSASLRCCDVFGNTGGDWVRCITDQLGVDGNFSLDPEFCELDSRDLRLRSSSPCCPESTEACGLIGALPAACR